MMQSCPNVHVLWSSHRVPMAEKNIHRVPIEFPFIVLGIGYQSIFYFTRVGNTQTTMKGQHERNTSKD